MQDTRGRHVSEGAFYPYRDESADGYDTVEWCAAQPWCNGDVGMFGISYHGAMQWLAAVEAPPALQAIAPGVTSDSYYDSWTYLGGAFQSFWISDWAAAFVLDNIGRSNHFTRCGPSVCPYAAGHAGLAGGICLLRLDHIVTQPVAK